MEEGGHVTGHGAEGEGEERREWGGMWQEVYVKGQFLIFFSLVGGVRTALAGRLSFDLGPGLDIWTGVW